MKIKRYTTILLLGVMLTACAPKVALQPGQPDPRLARAKRFGQVLLKALDAGIRLESNLAASGTIDGEVEPQLRKSLADAKIAVDEFNTRLATYTTFDLAKADIGKVLQDAVGFINTLNNNGILKIKNPRSQSLAAGILAGAQVAVDLYSVEFGQ